MQAVKKDTPNQSLTEVTLIRLRDDIVCGDWAPATKLNIESLKKRYQVGGTPVREALNQLVPLGLVMALPLKGFRVTALPVEAAQDVYATRRYLEKEMLRHALADKDDQWEAQCLAGLHRIKRCLQKEGFNEQPDIAQWAALNAAFWHVFFSAGDSVCLHQVHQGVGLCAQRYEYRLYRQSAQAFTLMQQQYETMVCLLDCCLESTVEAADHEHEQYLTQLLQAIEQQGQETA